MELLEPPARVAACRETLHLTVRGRRVAPVLAAGDAWLFPLPIPAREVRLRCQAFRPDLVGASPDTRRLGFALTRLQILTDAASIDIPVQARGLCDGFHAAEPGGWRWTDGDATLPDALFAALRRPALLLVRGFGRPGVRTTAQAWPSAFLAGDSYPADDHVETHLFAALDPFFATARLGQADLLPPGRAHHERAIAPRLARLAGALAGHGARPVLFGRSSGARVATLHAAGGGAAAVVCLGYPFRAPGGPAEPDRVRHLATLATPTLILQGRDDPYGGADIAGRVALSPQVQLEAVPGGHELHLDAAGWAALARRVLRFLAEIGARGSSPGLQ